MATQFAVATVTDFLILLNDKKTPLPLKKPALLFFMLIHTRTYTYAIVYIYMYICTYVCTNAFVEETLVLCDNRRLRHCKNRWLTIAQLSCWNSIFHIHHICMNG